MHQPLRPIVARLRFRRWSRSRAAVFHSLRVEVAIGRLSNSVLLSLARKTYAWVIDLANEAEKRQINRRLDEALWHNRGTWSSAMHRKLMRYPHHNTTLVDIARAYRMFPNSSVSTD